MKTNKELFKEFFEKEGHKFPNVSFSRMRKILTSPWKLIKEEMESGSLNSIRLTYFGVFEVKKGTIREIEKLNKRRLKKGEITEEEFNEMKKTLDNAKD